MHRENWGKPDKSEFSNPGQVASIWERAVFVHSARFFTGMWVPVRAAYISATSIFNTNKLKQVFKLVIRVNY